MAINSLLPSLRAKHLPGFLVTRSGRSDKMLFPERIGSWHEGAGRRQPFYKNCRRAQIESLRESGQSRTTLGTGRQQ